MSCLVSRVSQEIFKDVSRRFLKLSQQVSGVFHWSLKGVSRKIEGVFKKFSFFLWKYQCGGRRVKIQWKLEFMEHFHCIFLWQNNIPWCCHLPCFNLWEWSGIISWQCMYVGTSGGVCLLFHWLMCYRVHVDYNWIGHSGRTIKI